MPSYDRLSANLYRDDPSRSWGFRIQGGVDLNIPLGVQRVFLGGPAEGQLLRGDIIESINNYDTSNMTHKRADDLINMSGVRLTLLIQRPKQDYITPSYHQSQQNIPQYGSLNRYDPSYSRRSPRPAEAPGPSEYGGGGGGGWYGGGSNRTLPVGSVLSKTPPSSPRIAQQNDYKQLSKIQESLDNINLQKFDVRAKNLFSENGEGDEEAYNYVPVSEKKKMFSQPTYPPQSQGVRRAASQRSRTTSYGQSPKIYSSASSTGYGAKPVSFGWSPSPEKFQQALRAQNKQPTNPNVDTTPIHRFQKSAPEYSSAGSYGGAQPPSPTWRNNQKLPTWSSRPAAPNNQQPVKCTPTKRYGAANDGASDQEAGVSEF